MPYALDVRPDRRLAVVRLFGAAECDELVPACLALLTHPKWERGFSTLWDCLDVEAFRFVPEDVAAFEARADEIAGLRGPGRTAFVTRDPNVEINARFLGLKTRGDTGREFRAFDRMDEAEAWLAEGAGAVAG